MLFDRYITKASNLFVENRLLKFVVIVLAIMQVFSQCKLSQIEENQKTVIVPAGLTERVEVSGTSADISYLTAMGVYIATLRYSTTPRTVSSQYKILLTLFAPESYARYSEDYLSSALAQTKNEVTYTMRIEKVDIESEPEQVIKVAVAYNKYVFRDAVDSEKTTVLNIYYHIAYGKFIIDKIEEQKN